eukprot:359295-Chlamydomonas_euryale.AAC.3
MGTGAGCSAGREVADPCGSLQILDLCLDALDFETNVLTNCIMLVQRASQRLNSSGQKETIISVKQ